MLLFLCARFLLLFFVVSKLPKLEYLKVNNNPFVATENLILKERENHLDIIKSELQKLKETQIKVKRKENYCSDNSSWGSYCSYGWNVLCSTWKCQRYG